MARGPASKAQTGAAWGLRGRSPIQTSVGPCVKLIGEGHAQTGRRSGADPGCGAGRRPGVLATGARRQPAATAPTPFGTNDAAGRGPTPSRGVTTGGRVRASGRRAAGGPGDTPSRTRGIPAGTSPGTPGSDRTTARTGRTDAKSDGDAAQPCLTTADSTGSSARSAPAAARATVRRGAASCPRSERTPATTGAIAGRARGTNQRARCDAGQFPTRRRSLFPQRPAGVAIARGETPDPAT